MFDCKIDRNLKYKHQDDDKLDDVAPWNQLNHPYWTMYIIVYLREIRIKVGRHFHFQYLKYRCNHFELVNEDRKNN